MKGDFSRQTFKAIKHYSGVLMQMGRVQMDADWNEQGAITRYRDETEAIDVIGACGAPKNQAGFGITSDGKSLLIGAGRYYADGLLCENDADKFSFDDQSQGDLPNASLADALKQLGQATTTFGLVYLDVWQRHITALDDALIQEKALGEPDTTTRLKTVWQVKIDPVSTADPNADQRRDLLAKQAELKATADQLAAEAKQLQANIDQITAELNDLPPTDRLRRAVLLRQLKQLQDRQAVNQQAVANTQAELEKINRQLEDLPVAGRPTCQSAMGALSKGLTAAGLLNARTQVTQQQSDPCLLPPSAGYTRLENQLYRVEIHQGGKIGTATLKWSRDNGIVVTAIRKIDGKAISVQDVGRDSALGFEAGQWVELGDDALELNGLPGQLIQIDTVDAANRIITLKAAPTPLAGSADGVDPSRHPKLRRWDQTGTTATANGVPTATTWLPLEDGIEVQFGGSNVNSGDYWLIPARTASGEIEWPPFSTPNTNPIAQPPLGVAHHYCPLALIEIKDGQIEVAEDCRSLFPPLTELTATTAQAMRVVRTNWDNDDVFSTAQFLRAGLRVTLDAPPDPSSISDASMIVIAELPYVLSDKPQPNMKQSIILQGTPGLDPADPKTVVWTFDQVTARLQPRLLGLTPARATRARGTRAVGAAAAAEANVTRVRVSLKGHAIWRASANDIFYLDGQAFGRPATRAGDQAKRTALTFPSGSGARASDFESWFYLGEQAAKQPLQVKSVAFLTAAGGASSAGTVNFPRTDTKPISFKAGENVSTMLLTFNRAVSTDAVGVPPNKLPGVFVEIISAAGGSRRLTAALKQQSDNILALTLTEPKTFDVGQYRLTALGTDLPEAAALKAADDGTALDGDFDNTAGGNFVLAFAAA